MEAIAHQGSSPKLHAETGLGLVRPWPKAPRHRLPARVALTSAPPAPSPSWHTAAGDSPNVIHRHYKALVKEADAKEFSEITPDNVSQPIPFPVAATC